MVHSLLHQYSKESHMAVAYVFRVVDRHRSVEKNVVTSSTTARCSAMNAVAGIRPMPRRQQSSQGEYLHVPVLMSSKSPPRTKSLDSKDQVHGVAPARLQLAHQVISAMMQNLLICHPAFLSPVFLLPPCKLLRQEILDTHFVDCVQWPSR
jgi:hypothetical protein